MGNNAITRVTELETAEGTCDYYYNGACSFSAETSFSNTIVIGDCVEVAVNVDTATAVTVV